VVIVGQTDALGAGRGDRTTARPGDRALGGGQIVGYLPGVGTETVTGSAG
jgi:hypothetical protein